MTPAVRSRSPRWFVWIGVLVAALGAGACGGNAPARSGGDAGGDAADGGSPEAAEVPLAPTDTAGPAMDLTAAMEVAPAADTTPDARAADSGPGEVAAADALSSGDALPPADVLVGPPTYDDLIVSGVHLQTFEGKTVYLAVQSNAGTFRSSVTVASGQFVVTLPRAFDRDTFGMFVRIFVDLNGDGHCTAADAGGWSVFADNSARRGQPQPVEFDPQRESLTAGECQYFP
ncbi:MAG TPA: hypothetical protein VNO55_08320 [Polyangia bacterium]|nr:hypothetical protein [Polyangia bacterium]